MLLNHGVNNAPLGKTILTFGAAAFVFVFLTLSAFTAGQEKPPGIQGTILINITCFGYNFIEFKL
jgi:hypothetical protein